MIILNDNLYFHKQFTLLDNQLWCIEIMFKMPESSFIWPPLAKTKQTKMAENAGIFRPIYLYFFKTLI